MQASQEVAGWALRELLGPGHSHGGEDEAGHDEEQPHGSTKALRVASVFVILVAGLIGSLPLFNSKVFQNPSHPLPRLLRALSAGVLLSLALVHIIPEAVTELGQLTSSMSEKYPYNVAGPCIVFGILAMVTLDSALHSFIESRVGVAAAHHANHGGNGHAHVALHLTKQAVAESTEQHSPQPVAEGKEGPGIAKAHQPNVHACGGSTHSKEAPSPVVLEPHTHVCAGHTHVCLGAAGSKEVPGAAIMDPHTHVCLGSAQMALESVQLATVHDHVLATMFELGCIFHSFIIGLTLGVIANDKAGVRNLLIALAFHQWLEGIALGSFIARAHISKWKGVLMVIIYSLTCPVGIAIGIGISESYDPESTTAIATQGVFNGISGGLLLYVALVQLIAEDFSRREVTSLPKAGSQQTWVGPARHVALFLGAAFMAMLAIWA